MTSDDIYDDIRMHHRERRQEHNEFKISIKVKDFKLKVYEG